MCVCVFVCLCEYVCVYARMDIRDVHATIMSIHARGKMHLGTSIYIYAYLQQWSQYDFFSVPEFFPFSILNLLFLVQVACNMYI